MDSSWIYLGVAWVLCWSCWREMRRQRLGKKWYFIVNIFLSVIFILFAVIRESVETCVFTRDDADRTDGDEVTEGENFWNSLINMNNKQKNRAVLSLFEMRSSHRFCLFTCGDVGGVAIGWSPFSFLRGGTSVSIVHISYTRKGGVLWQHHTNTNLKSKFGKELE